MTAASPLSRRVLEESPEYFWERFSQYAQTWLVSPEPLGSPLLEVLTPLGPLFAFDRTLAPFTKSETSLIFHGQVTKWESAQNTSAIQHLEGGRYRISGRVEAVLDASFFVLKVEDTAGETSTLFVLAAQNPPDVGRWVTVQLAPPLMVFRPDSYLR